MLAQKPETGETSYQEVVKTFVREVDQVVHVVVEGTEIQTTKEHPFYVEGEGFVRAGSLRSGDVLRLADGENATVWKVWAEALDEKVPVYNFEVADCHTYYVSEFGVQLIINVYFGIKNGEPSYTGITRQTINTRLYQHNRSGKNFDELRTQYDNLTRNQARAIEQYYIENGPNKLNKINSIGKKNKYYKDAMNWAKQYLGVK